MKTILDMCGGSGAWSEPYKAMGYDVRLITLPSDIRFLEFDDSLQVHGILAAPPCRCFTAAGAGVLRSQAEMYEALSVVDACLRAVAIYKPLWWALENPAGAMKRFLGPAAYCFHPWWFQGNRSKLTCLWGSFNPPKRLFFKKPIVTVSTGCIGHSGDARRSVTPEGFAKAFQEANP